MGVAVAVTVGFIGFGAIICQHQETPVRGIFRFLYLNFQIWLFFPYFFSELLFVFINIFGLTIKFL